MVQSAQIFKEWDIKISDPFWVTVGHFDGVHIGHQYLLRDFQSYVGKSAKRMIITFRNHPRTILCSGSEPRAIMRSEQKVELLASLNVADYLLDVEFTKEISQLNPEEFLKILKKMGSLYGLYLGHDSILGRSKLGTPNVMQEICMREGVHLRYAKPFEHHDTRPSSQRVREAIAEGNLERVCALLGRPYSLQLEVVYSSMLDTNYEISVLDLDVDFLMLPPKGSYAAYVRLDHSSWQMAVADLSSADSLSQQSGSVCLKVYVMGKRLQSKPVKVEVKFHSLLLKEKESKKPDQFRERILQDILHKTSCTGHWI